MWINLIFWIFIIVFILVIVACLLLKSYAQDKLYYPVYDINWRSPIPHENIFIYCNFNEFDKSYEGYVIDAENYDFNEINNDKHLKGPSGYINAWHFHNFEHANTIIFCHGNAGNISQRDYVIDICQQFGLNLLLIDYRGFGLSSGTPDPVKLREDGQSAYDYLNTYCKLDSSSIIIWGESLGGAVATHIAANNNCRCLILLSTFSCISDAIYHSEAYPSYMMVPLSYLVPIFLDDMPSKDILQYVECPVAIVHSTEDELINYKCAEILYENVENECKVMITIKGGHSSPVLNNDSLLQLLSFADVCVHSCHLDSLAEISKSLRTVAGRHFPGGKISNGKIGSIGGGNYRVGRIDEESDKNDESDKSDESYNEYESYNGYVG